MLLFLIGHFSRCVSRSDFGKPKKGPRETKRKAGHHLSLDLATLMIMMITMFPGKMKM